MAWERVFQKEQWMAQGLILNPGLRNAGEGAAAGMHAQEGRGGRGGGHCRGLISRPAALTRSAKGRRECPLQGLLRSSASLGHLEQGSASIPQREHQWMFRLCRPRALSLWK